jgi:hypothetical protein
MKKIYCIALISFGISFAANSQTIKVGTLIGDLGFGFGWPISYYNQINSPSAIPVISLSAEQGVYEVPDLGVLTVGGIIGYKSASESYDLIGLPGKETWNDFLIAVKGNFHLTVFHINNIDPYAGIALGGRIELANTPVGLYGGSNANTTNGYVLVAVYLGCRYYFTNNLAVFGELGYGLGDLTLGVSYKLK